MLSTVAFLLHAAVETPAAATFLFAPARQLSPALFADPRAATELALVLQNLGGLLAASVALSVVMAVVGSRSLAVGGGLRGAVLVCLASYHVFPCRRAYVRLTRGIGLRGPQGQVLGGPSMHLVAHVVCLAVMLWAGIADLWRSR